MNLNRKTFLNYFLLISWMGMIFYLSSQPDLKSGFESQIDFILRKAAHIMEYGILAFLAWHAASGGGAGKNSGYLFAAVVFSFLFSVSDEYHQTFVAGRVGSAQDVLIDNIGVAIMTVLVKIKLSQNSFIK